MISLWLLPSLGLPRPPAGQTAAAKRPEVKASDKTSKLSGQPSESTESEFSEQEAGKAAPGQSVLSVRLGRTPAGGNGVLPQRLSARRLTSHAQSGPENGRAVGLCVPGIHDSAFASPDVPRDELVCQLGASMTGSNPLVKERRPCPLGGAGPALLQPADVLAGEATSSDGQLASHEATRLE